MDFDYTEEEKLFRERARRFVWANVTKEVQEETEGGGARGPHARGFLRAMAREKLLGICWPKEYGGLEMPPVYDFILNDECALAHAPQPGKGVGIIGRTLITHGSEFLKRKFIPMILTAEVEFAIGYTEPDAGSDLAALKLSAKEDGDDYVLNGQKVFTSSAHCAEWVWLLARTDPDAPKHKGVSLFLVDLSWPGVTIRGIETMGGERTNEVFYDNVRVPREYLVGDRGKGFKYGMEALAFERHVMFPAGLANGKLNILVEWLKEAELGGLKVAKDPVVRHKVARLAIEMETSRMLELNILHATQKGETGDSVAAMHKLYASKLEMRIAETGVDIMGAYGQLKAGSKHAQAEGEFEYLVRRSVIRAIGGGSSEIQKNVIAKRHLGLPG